MPIGKLQFWANICFIVSSYWKWIKYQFINISKILKKKKKKNVSYFSTNRSAIVWLDLPVGKQLTSDSNKIFFGIKPRRSPSSAKKLSFMIFESTFRSHRICKQEPNSSQSRNPSFFFNDIKNVFYKKLN